MNRSQSDYWQECIACAASECHLKLTQEQLECLADAVKIGHEQYGMAFYSPPASDRLSDIESEWKAKLKAKEEEHERYVENAEKAVSRALRVQRGRPVSIGAHGEVFAHGGRTEQIQ